MRTPPDAELFSTTGTVLFQVTMVLHGEISVGRENSTLTRKPAEVLDLISQRTGRIRAVMHAHSRRDEPNPH